MPDWKNVKKYFDYFDYLKIAIELVKSLFSHNSQATW